MRYFLQCVELEAFYGGGTRVFILESRNRGEGQKTSMDPGRTNATESGEPVDGFHPLRRQALELIDNSIDADAAVFFDAREVEDDVYLGSSKTIGDEFIDRGLASMRDAPMPELLQSIIRGPLPDDRDQFLTLRQRLELRGIDPSEPDKRPWGERFDVSDWVGLLVYHGARFIGWIGAWRRQPQQPFSPTDCARLNEQLDELRDLLVEAYERESDSLNGHTRFLLFTADGSTSHTSPDLQSWLDDERRQALAKLIEEAPKCAHEGSHIVSGMCVTITALDGLDTEPAHLVRLTPARYPRIRPETVLTPTQKEVARLATTGATVEEMARMLHRSPHTVKTHLKHIYRRLDINSRVQLVDLIGG